MANKESAKKAIRSGAKKAVYNLRTKRAYKTARKDVLSKISNKDKDAASALLPNAYKQLDKAVKKNVLKKNTAARYKSGLAKKIAAL